MQTKSIENQLQNHQHLRSTADRVQAYVDAHLFDDACIMMSGIDSHTDEPFPREFVTKIKVPRRGRFDPWSYWTYEDSMMSTGHFIEGLILKYEVTGDSQLLERADFVWQTCLDVYYQSQAYGGVGCFLRPYGGFDQMEKFGEPLGTDQAGPVLFGAIRLAGYVDSDRRAEIVRVIVNMLKWYADNGYVYRYYKSHQHRWQPPGHHHASSFYLPALAFAYAETGESRWKDDLSFHLERMLISEVAADSAHGLAWNFKQGGLLHLKQQLQRIDDPSLQFELHLTDKVLKQMYDDVQRWLARYSEPGTLYREFPESAAKGFVPYEQPHVHIPRNIVGLPYSGWVHAGRQMPRHELTVLTALGVLGNQSALEQASQLFQLRSDVPRDFTSYLSEDYDVLPECKHLYARAVGAMMLDWWRNVWVLLRQTCEQGKGSE